MPKIFTALFLCLSLILPVIAQAEGAATLLCTEEVGGVKSARDQGQYELAVQKAGLATDCFTKLNPKDSRVISAVLGFEMYLISLSGELQDAEEWALLEKSSRTYMRLIEHTDGTKAAPAQDPQLSRWAAPRKDLATALRYQDNNKELSELLPELIAALKAKGDTIAAGFYERQLAEAGKN